MMYIWKKSKKIKYKKIKFVSNNYILYKIYIKYKIPRNVN